jgi:hypothetical protein
VLGQKLLTLRRFAQAAALAAANIAAGYKAKSRDIGNIMFTADFAALAANLALVSRLPCAAEADFTSVGLMARFPLLLVEGTLPDPRARSPAQYT